MHTKLLSVALAATFLTGCGTMSGGGSSDGEAGNKHHVLSSAGGVVGLSGDGCLRTSAFDAETANCGGDGDAMAKEGDGDGIAKKDEMSNAEKFAAIAEKAGIDPDAPPPPPPPKPAPTPAPTSKVEKVVLSGRALFPYDSAQLTGQGNREMDTLIGKLKNYSDIELIDVVGHADSRGSLEYNQGLSERRAETVKSTLQGAFPQVPITASGLGETAPVQSNDTAEGRRLNRRVEIRVEAIN